MTYSYEHMTDLLYGIMDSRNAASADHGTVRILSEFYPDSILATRDVKSCHKPYVAISRLLQKNYLERTGGRHPDIQYRITLKGKCRIMCQEFNIRFLCLCIMCEAYCLHRSQIIHGCETFYVIQDIKDIFGEIYEYKSITNSANILHRRGFTRRRTRDTIEICDKTMKRLEAHQSTINELHKWIAGVQGMLNRKALESLSV